MDLCAADVDLDFNGQVLSDSRVVEWHSKFSDIQVAGFVRENRYAAD